MPIIRDPVRTRAAIIDAAVREFSLRGYDGTTMAAVARRAKVSKQLLQHHFGTKEELFRNVHAARFRPSDQWDEHVPEDATALFVSRFEKRANDQEYVRFLAWEAASTRNRTVPGQKARMRRLTQYGAALQHMQQDGRIPADIDYRLLQLAITALATYPVAFSQITQLITGSNGTDEEFRRRWAVFLKLLGERLFAHREHAPPRGEIPTVSKKHLESV